MFFSNLKNFPLLRFCYELLLLKFKLLFNTVGNNNSLSPRRFEHLKKLEKSKKKKKRGQDWIKRQCWCFFVSVFLCLFSRLLREGGGIGAQKVDVS